MPLTCLLMDITNAPNALVVQDNDHDTNPSLVVHRTTRIMCPLLAAVSLLPKPNSNGTYLLAARDALPYAFLLSFPPVLSLAGRHSVLFAVHTVLPFAARVCYSLCPVFRLLLVRAPACRLLCPLPFPFLVPRHVAPFACTLSARFSCYPVAVRTRIPVFVRCSCGARPSSAPILPRRPSCTCSSVSRHVRALSRVCFFFCPHIQA